MCLYSKLPNAMNAAARDKLHLHMILNEDELRDAALLVFVNKKDLPNALNAAKTTDKYGLHCLRQRHCWYIQSTMARSSVCLGDSREDSFLCFLNLCCVSAILAYTK